MPPPDAPKDGRVLRGHKGGLSKDGRLFQVTFIRVDGTEHEIIIPFDNLADFIGLFESTSAEALRLQSAALHGQDRRLFYPIKKRTITSIGGSVTSDGIPILTLVIDNRIQQDIALPPGQIPELIAWLRQLEQDAKNHPKATTN